MKQLIVVDDFYSDPMAVREIALRATYEDVRPLNYPGGQSNRSYCGDGIRTAFSRIVGDELDIDERKLTFGRFRLMTQGGETRLKVHADGGADWSGLIYLNLPGQCDGGTAFYRHVNTGLSEVPSESEANQLGFKNCRALLEEIMRKDSTRIESWEQTTFVAMRFNRLILFRGSKLFHSHTSSWGNGIEDGRLTQNFFFDTCHK